MEEEYNNNEAELNDDNSNLSEGNEIDYENYNVWKKNTPFLYNVLITKGLTWPSLTLSWLKTQTINTNSSLPFITQSLLVGTHTSDQEMNQLIFMKIKYPKKELYMNNSSNYERDDELIHNNQYNILEDKIKIETIMTHNGDVNKTKIKPGEESIIATKSSNSDVYLFDKRKHKEEPHNCDSTCLQCILVGHDKEGYGLNWCELDSDILVSGSDDGKVCIWKVSSSCGSLSNVGNINNSNYNIGNNGIEYNVNNYMNNINNNNNNNVYINNNITTNNNTNSNPQTQVTKLSPLITFTSHDKVVEDVSFSKKNGFIFGSVSDDRTLKIYDIRVNKVIDTVQAHSNNINTLDFNYENEFYLLTGSSDKTIALWDLRYLNEKMHSFEYHNDEVISVKWNPNKESVFASGGADKRVMVWDVMNIGKDLDEVDLQDGPSELLVSLCYILFCIYSVYAWWTHI